MYKTPKKSNFLNSERIRFFKPITSYLVNTNSNSIFFNLYYKTSLETFQSLNKSSVRPSDYFFDSLHEKNKLKQTFYF